MADENANLNDDHGMEDALPSDSSVKPKKAGLLSTLLKYIALALAALIFIVTVVVITVNLLSRNGKSHSEYPIAEEYRDSREILQYYSAIEAVKTSTRDTVPGTVIVKVELGYPANDKATPQELTARLVELKDFLRSYFQNKTIAELRQEEKIKIEIRNEINDNILSKSKIKGVAFTQYDIIEQ
ncbi:MAG: flagellar basal body-associated FliL family protein [Treponema sp.]|uniref:flagellar basal body-associated FliL family protein n=1 Tax=Treponema sp. TaxID=166 RepID=UPI003FA301B0